MLSRKPDSQRRSAWARYGVAIITVVLGWLAREGLTPIVGPTALPFIFFFPAVAMAAWYGGLLPGAVAVVLSLLAADWFFIEGVHTWSVATFGEVAALTAFLVSCLFIVGAMEGMHRARARALGALTERERAEAELARVREQFAATVGGAADVAAKADALSRGQLVKSTPRGAKPASHPILLVFLSAALLLVVSTVIVYRVGLIRMSAQEKMSNQLLVLQRLEDFLSALKDAETGQRGYLLTGDELYLRPYSSALGVVRARFNALQQLERSGELPKGKVERIGALTEQKLSELERTVQLRREQGVDAALAIVRDDQGRQVMDEIRTHIGGMRADEQKEFAQASAQADRAAHVRTATFVAACLLNLAFLAWALGKVANEVRRRETVNLEMLQQRELLATTLASIGDAVIATDSDGCVIFLNPEAERLTGWKNSEAAERSLPEVFRVTNEKTREPVENPVQKVLRLGEVAGLANHTLLVAKDGRRIPIDDSAAPIRQPDGPLFGVVLVFRDVTAQRKAQEVAERLAAIVEHSGEAMVTKSLDGIIRTWNASAERLFGYRAEEIIGKPVTVLFPPERLTEEDHILGRLREGRPVERLETIRVAKDGRRIPVALSVSPLRDADGEIVGASKVIHDVTDLVAAREALVREKELLATTLASIGDAVIVTDPEGRITFLNAEAERLTKWKNADATGQPLPKVFRIVNEESRARVEDPVEKVLRLGMVVGLANHTVLIASDGTETPIDDSAAPIHQSGGPLLGVVLVFRDFTERKEAEKALREAHEQLGDRAVQLEKLVQERTARLQDMLNELQHVSYAIAHDMRAPLRAMNAFASLLSEEAAAGATPAQTEEYCGRIMTAASRLDKLIQDALHYTKLAQQEMPLVPVDLSKLVRELIETYPNLHPEKASIVIENQLPPVLGNDALLTQCFSNLLGNAVKFVAPGVRPEIRVSSEIRDKVARIWVKDKGIGIPKNAQERLFKMFEKLDVGYEGTGIGLAIVRKVVERMGGKVGVESEPGQGSSFWVELPLTNSLVDGDDRLESRR